MVVTSISEPNTVLKSLAQGSSNSTSRFIVVGDSKSPANFELIGCDFYNFDRKRSLPFKFAKLCHERSYDALIDLKLVDLRELDLLKAWFTDLR
jgi:hypothetical protein